MTIDRKPDGETFLSRWSRRKLESARTPQPPAPSPASSPAVSEPTAATQRAATPAAPVAPAESLPPVESLSFDSDFTAFLKPDVDESVRRAALRKLLHDSRFNVMDGLDVYIDDYTKTVPLDPSVIPDLVQARYIFSPPATRLTAEGIVEDVPPEADTAAVANAAAEPSIVSEGNAAPASLPPAASQADAHAAPLLPVEASPRHAPSRVDARAQSRDAEGAPPPPVDARPLQPLEAEPAPRPAAHARDAR